jgi:hypothetical protein
MVQDLVGQFLLQRQLLAVWFLRWHEDLHLGKRERQKAKILQQSAPGRQGIRCRIGNPFIMDTASVRRTQKEDREQGIDQQNIFYRVVVFLAAITFRLCRRVLGADDAPFGSVPSWAKGGPPVRGPRVRVPPPAA